LNFSKELLTAGVMFDEEMVELKNILLVHYLLFKVVEMMFLEHNYLHPSLCL